MTTSKHILDIGDLHPDRPTVLIRTSVEPDGHVHELRMYHELAVSELAEVIAMAQKAERMGNKPIEELQPKEIRRMEGWLNAILGIAIHPSTPLLDDERAELTITQKAEIVGAFTKHCLVTVGDEQVVPVAPTPRKRARTARTGAKS